MTKICVSTVGMDLDSQVDPRFGRCAYFLIVDPVSMEFELVPNEGAMAAGGAGIRAAQVIVPRGVKSLITGSVGPNAHLALRDSGIGIFKAPVGTVRNAVEEYVKGSLEQIVQPGPAHRGMGFGLGRTVTPGAGYGWGGGRLRWSGRGHRRRGGRNW